MNILLVAPDEPRIPLWWPDGSALHLHRVGDLAAAIASLASDSHGSPELIVLVESRPGQFSHHEILSLQQRAPLARVWRLLGSWCEGEARSGRPAPGCQTIYWHQWEPRLRRELERIAHGRLPSWAWAATLTAEERLLAAAAERERFQEKIPPMTRIAVCAPSASTADALATACRRRGYPVQLASESSADRIAADALLWDTSSEALHDEPRVCRLLERAQAPLIALVGFPRPEDIQQALASGIAAVISKPFLLDDLWTQLELKVAGALRVP